MSYHAAHRIFLPAEGDPIGVPPLTLILVDPTMTACLWNGGQVDPRSLPDPLTLIPSEGVPPSGT
jgi:hypothetical protein